MAVKCQNSLKARKFFSFLGTVSIDQGQGRQFVSQLGALAERESLRANSLSIKYMVYKRLFLTRKVRNTF